MFGSCAFKTGEQLLAWGCWFTRWARGGMGRGGPRASRQLEAQLEKELEGQVGRECRLENDAESGLPLKVKQPCEQNERSHVPEQKPGTRPT
ncbi:hypothetical protein chiPu_0010646 [Chiloscyllium punctatum]|uniref:Uncharacterized protein n=1 Tax=Chiloscyllium punctatum TaxID=137246 RepID=A0A401SP86_CHIPU|nr:hypothetical protein [Chiloscyllium punctatum]